MVAASSIFFTCAGCTDSDMWLHFYAGGLQVTSKFMMQDFRKICSYDYFTGRFNTEVLFPCFEFFSLSVRYEVTH